MEINDSSRKVLLVLFKEFSEEQTITSLAKAVKMTRPGVFKIVKSLEREKLVVMSAIGKGKTSTSTVRLQRDHPLLEKLFSLFLASEANDYVRWQNTFKPIENFTDFVIIFGSILHSPKEANDIDILCISEKEKFLGLERSLHEIRKAELRMIHAVQFTPNEFKNELKNRNPAFIDAIRKGVVLFGHERFISFMEELNTK
ncbi:MAG: hypothetical protein ABIJ21_06410 [Nanoarchaeota archaeon]